MYNRYLSTAEGTSNFSSEASQEIHTGEFEKNVNKDTVAGLFGNITSLLGGKIRKPELSLDNIVMLVVIYFLVADSDDFDTELLIIVGILLFLGV